MDVEDLFLITHGFGKFVVFSILEFPIGKDKSWQTIGCGNLIPYNVMVRLDTYEFQIKGFDINYIKM